MKNNNYIIDKFDDFNDLYNTIINKDHSISTDKTTYISIYPIELEYEKIKIKFNKALLKYLKNMKNDYDYYLHIYNTFFDLWKKIAIERKNISLFNLLKYLTKKDSYNIKKTIFDTVTYDNLKDTIYIKFINDFIKLLN